MKPLLVFALLFCSFVTLTANTVDEKDILNAEADGEKMIAANILDELLIRREIRSLDKKKEKKNKDKKSKLKSKDKERKKKTNSKSNKNKKEKKRGNKKIGKRTKKKKKKGQKNKKNKGNRKKKKRKTKKKNKKKKLSADNDLRSKKNETCSIETVAASCLDNAMIALNYEKNQVTNYLKQAARLKGHKNIKEKKLFKKGEFMHAAEHLIFAVGGNMSNPQCGDPNDNSTEALATKAKEFEYILSNYTQLVNCSNAIHEACTLTNETFNDSHQDQLDACNQTKWQFILDSRKCHKLQAKSTNATEICECWNKAAEDVETIKSKKCETKKKQNAITKQKNFCKQVFKNCKDMEDHSIHLTWHCMHDHSMHLINQTSKSIHEGIIKDAKSLTGDQKLFDFSYYDYK